MNRYVTSIIIIRLQRCKTTICFSDSLLVQRPVCVAVPYIIYTQLARVMSFALKSQRDITSSLAHSQIPDLIDSLAFTQRLMRTRSARASILGFYFVYVTRKPLFAYYILFFDNSEFRFHSSVVLMDFRYSFGRFLFRLRTGCVNI